MIRIGKTNGGLKSYAVTIMKDGVNTLIGYNGITAIKIFDSVNGVLAATRGYFEQSGKYKSYVSECFIEQDDIKKKRKLDLTMKEAFVINEENESCIYGKGLTLYIPVCKLFDVNIECRVLRYETKYEKAFYCLFSFNDAMGIKVTFDYGHFTEAKPLKNELDAIKESVSDLPYLNDFEYKIQHIADNIEPEKRHIILSAIQKLLE
jgi:hypothetical protein